MAALAIIAFFVILGLAVVLVAMQGGPRGARERLHSQSRQGTRGMMSAVGVVILVFGIGLPAFVLLYNSDEQASAGPAGSELSASLQEGRALFARNCSTCHTLDDANAVGRVGPDFDVLRPAKALAVNAIEQGRARGQGQMPADLLQGKQAQQVAAYVAAVAGR